MNMNDFQAIYREHAYEVYRAAFEELRDADATRECVYEVFTRIRREGLTDPDEIRAKIPEYRSDYINQFKTAQLDVDQVWYRLRNDELTEAEEVQSIPSFRERLRDEARRSREAQERQKQIVEPAVASPAAEEASVTTPAAEAAPVVEPVGAELESVEPMAEPVHADEVAPEVEADIAEPEVEETVEAAVEPQEKPAAVGADLAAASAAIATAMAEAAAASAKQESIAQLEEAAEEFVAEASVPEPEKTDHDSRVWGDANDDEDDDESEEKKKGSPFFWIILIIIILLFCWVLADVLMYIDIIPRFDLGYGWFNSTLYPLFPWAP